MILETQRKEDIVKVGFYMLFVRRIDEDHLVIHGEDGAVTFGGCADDW